MVCTYENGFNTKICVHHIQLIAAHMTVYIYTLISLLLTVPLAVDDSIHISTHPSTSHSSECQQPNLIRMLGMRNYFLISVWTASTFLPIADIANICFESQFTSVSHCWRSIKHTRIIRSGRAVSSVSSVHIKIISSMMLLLLPNSASRKTSGNFEWEIRERRRHRRKAFN